jgi:hypothetical protein
VLYKSEYGKQITAYQWDSSLNKWKIPDDIHGLVILGFAKEPLLDSTETEIEVYIMDTSSVTAEEGDIVDYYSLYNEYENSYTFYDGMWILSRTVPSKENVDIT